MDKKYTTLVFWQVFRYLTPEDLSIAAQVSKNWCGIIKYERYARNTYLYIFDKVIINFGLQWNFKNNYEEEYFNVISSLGVFSSNIDTDVNVIRGSQIGGSFMVNLKSNFNMKPIKEKTSFFIFTFPVGDSADITILSYINRRIGKKIRCRLLNFATDEEEQKTKFLVNLEQYFKQTDNSTCILIIFCQHTCYKNLLKLFNCLQEWYDCSDMVIWISVIDELSICRYDFDSSYCKINTEFVFIFINNPLINVYVYFILESSCNPEKIRTELKNLKNETALSLSSMALMHVPYVRLRKIFELDVFIFREVFPDVNLLPIYGTTSTFGFCFCGN
ncbi:hypothetical protein M0802_015808 [Mischocyttarus mexicanus]|nr:hypothetical protein M0802_015808 [Mischocyttarus mexicanus]